MKGYSQNLKTGSSLQRMIAIYFCVLTVLTIFVASILFFIIMAVLGINGPTLYNAAVIYLIMVIFALGLLLLISFILSVQLAGKISQPINSFKNFIQGQLTGSNEKYFPSDVSSYYEITDLSMVCSNFVNDYREMTKQVGISSSLLYEKLRTVAENIEKLKDIEYNQTRNISSIVQLSEQMNGLVIQDMSESFTSNNKTDKKTLKGMTNIHRTIQNLNTNIKSISTVSEIIRQVAEQTNLLSVNAAIEASKAGESGKGFSIVADEMKRLSERVFDSALTVEEIITSLSAESTEFNSLVKKSIDSGENLINLVYDKISARTSSINQHIKDITNEFEKNTRIIQQTTVVLQEIAFEVKKLNKN